MRPRVFALIGAIAASGFLLSRDGTAEVASLPRGGATHIDRIVITKSAHTLVAYAGELPVLRTKVALGPGGAGPKLQEGDQITPVGRYRIVSNGPSRFRRFLGLDYPNAADRARFADLKKRGLLGKEARIGGDIGIHAPPTQAAWKAGHKLVDWTLGCVAVDDDEIDVLAKHAPVGTVVDILD